MWVMETRCTLFLVCERSYTHSSTDTMRDGSGVNMPGKEAGCESNREWRWRMYTCEAFFQLLLGVSLRTSWLSYSLRSLPGSNRRRPDKGSRVDKLLATGDGIDAADTATKTTVGGEER